MNFIRRPEVLSQRASKDGGPEIACLYRMYGPPPICKWIFTT
jgi:hypothetical protein